jgi:hypothetical protein
MVLTKRRDLSVSTWSLELLGAGGQTEDSGQSRREQTPRFRPPSQNMASSSSGTPRPTLRRAPGSDAGTTTTTGSTVNGEKRQRAVTPAVLRSIFASSRTVLEERSISRLAFFRYVARGDAKAQTFTLTCSSNRFTGFVLSCVIIGFIGARNSGRTGIAKMLAMV